MEIEVITISDDDDEPEDGMAIIDQELPQNQQDLDLDIIYIDWLNQYVSCIDTIIFNFKTILFKFNIFIQLKFF